ncbi:hypothetical protein [Burkholderia diffusa]
MIFSLYGTNFENMPELKVSSGYPMTLGVMLTECAVLDRKLGHSG